MTDSIDLTPSSSAVEIIKFTLPKPDNRVAAPKKAVQIDPCYGQRMMREVERLLSRFISYPSDHCRTAHALWIIHTHLLRHFDSTPRLAFLSPEPASGKTRALEITEGLVLNPVPTVNVSPAYLFRKVGSGDATILFDEIDTVFGPKAKDNEDIRGLLNAGHRRGAVVGRCVVKGKTIETEEVPAFAPVALAGLGWLPDTLMSRAVVIRMRRRAVNETVEPFRRRLHDSDTDKVRTMIEVWAKAVWSEGIETWPDLPAEIQDRDADIWEPLIAIADEIGGDWPAAARGAAVTLVTASKDREQSLGIRLLSDLQKVFGDRDQVPTVALLEALIGREEAPWGDLRGKPLDPRGLARQLKQYDIKPEVLWFGSRQERGYRRSDFAEAWGRYLPQSPAASVTSVTSAIPANVTHITDVTRPQPDRGEDQSSQQAKCSHCGKGGETLPVSRSGTDVRLHHACIDAWTVTFDGARQ
jgi:Protein of unknown function (DUF3631)